MKSTMIDFLEALQKDKQRYSSLLMHRHERWGTGGVACSIRDSYYTKKAKTRLI
jgi:hypothetical protein